MLFVSDLLYQWISVSRSASSMTLLVSKLVRLMLDILSLFSRYKCGIGRENNLVYRIIVSILLPEAKKKNISLRICFAFYIVDRNYLNRKVIIQLLTAINCLIHYKARGIRIV